MLFRSEMHNIPIQVTAFSLIYCFDVFQQTSIDITAKQIKRKKIVISILSSSSDIDIVQYQANSSLSQLKF